MELEGIVEFQSANSVNDIHDLITERLNKYRKINEDFPGQLDVRFTPVTYITSRRSILYDENGPFWACDFRRLLSHDPKEPPYYLGTIYLQDDLIDHIRANFEAAWENSVELNQV